MIDKIVSRMQLLGGVTELSGSFEQEAAVLIAITRDSERPEVILTKRADHLSAHSGEVAFPGGKWEADDQTLLDTALRETEEEIGLPAQKVQVLGALPPHYSKGMIKVTPFVGLVDADIELTPNPDELDSIFRVPLAFLIDDKRLRTDIFDKTNNTFWAPAYLYQGFEIWGFTARVLKTFLGSVLQVDLVIDNVAPVRRLDASVRKGPER